MGWSRKKRFLFFLSLLLGIVIAGTFLWPSTSSHKLPTNAESIHDASSSFENPFHSNMTKSLTGPFTVPWVHTLRPMTMLLVGIDSRSGEPSRSDTMILATLNPDHHVAHLIPIPRDTRVYVTGQGMTKINHAMFFGGTALLQKTVEHFTGHPVDQIVLVDFAGFKKVVDLLGGIDLNIEHKMDYDDPSDGTHIHLLSGQQHLNGEKALDYARFRNDPEADTGRMRRQQQVVRAIIEKGSSLENLPKLYNLIQIAGQHIQTTIKPMQLIQLTKVYWEGMPFIVNTETITGTNRIDENDQLWYFNVDQNERMRLKQAIASWLKGNDVDDTSRTNFGSAVLPPEYERDGPTDF